MLQAQQLEEQEKELEKRDVLRKEHIARLEATVGNDTFTHLSCFFFFIEINIFLKFQVTFIHLKIILCNLSTLPSH